MPLRAAVENPDLAQQMAQTFLLNDQMNQLLLECLDPRAWRAKPPGKTRAIADIFSHMHNMRRKWIRLSAPQIKLPAELDRRECTQKQARKALAESARCSAEMIEQAMSSSGKSFLRDGWARPWQPGVAMLAYMVAHEGHHRGQVCMLAHQMGFRLPVKAGAGMWGWEKLAKECGLELPGPR